MAYAANRHPGVRAAVAWSPEIARLAREHNDANVLVLPARFVSEDEGVEILQDVAGHGLRGRAAQPPSGKNRPGAGMSLDHNASLREADPSGGASHRPGAAAPAARPRADRQRELRQPGGHRRHGHAAHQQVRRGLSGPAVLRRVRGGRRGRAAGHRPAEAAVRRRARQRAAALRRAGQLRGVHGGHQAGRDPHGDVAAARRPPLARRGGEPQRRHLAGGALRRRSGHRPDRLRRGPRAGQAGAAQAHHRRRQRVRPDHRLRRRSARSPTRSGRSSWWTWRTSPGWWPAACIRRPCRTRRWSPAPPTRRCAARAPG